MSPSFGTEALPGEGIGSEVIQQVLEQLHRELSDCREGAVAEYIPELAKADPEDFGIVIATVDGRIYSIGDWDTTFTIQSISKPFMYGLALTLLSPQHMQGKVGVEPSGDSFNAISLEPFTGRPRNPMINAGAIATAAQVWHHDPVGAETTTLGFFSALAGRPLQVEEEVYRSERQTGHRNRAISHLLRNVSVIESEPEGSLDLYFRQCSIGINCRDLAVMAATLACQGRNPLTNERPLDSPTTARMLAVMGSCGMYDYAGQWLYDVGIPAKSGVGGGVLAAVPGRLGIGVYSPRLDRFGNSVRGIAACRRLSENLQLHLFDRNPLGQSAVRCIYRGTERRSRCWRSPADGAWLQPRRARIAILHAQGVLDFAAMEQLLAKLEASTTDSSVMVLDLGQVIELPPSSGALLQRQAQRLQAAGVPLLLCRVDHLELPDTASAGDPIPCFPSLDLALEQAETVLLGQRPAAAETSAPLRPLPLEQVPPEHRPAIEELLRLRSYRAGEVVMTADHPGGHLYIVARGRFSISLAFQPGRSPLRRARMATFTAGMMFGDVAFLTGQRPMADVVAETAGEAWQLDRGDFEQLQQSNPRAAIALLMLLGMDLGRKLALCSQQLTMVEQL